MKAKPTTSAAGAPTGGLVPAPGGSGAGTLRDKIIHALRQVFDPEIPVNLVDLGLIASLGRAMDAEDFDPREAPRRERAALVGPTAYGLLA